MELTPSLTLSQCLNQAFSCRCGRTHQAELAAVIIEKDAMLQLPVWLLEQGYHAVYLICDSITVELAGRRALALLEDAGLDVCLHVISPAVYDEGALGELLINKDSRRDVVVGVGTGSINDMCRYFSAQVDLPYCILATAAPMDGFASSISAFTVNHLKTTFQARTPKLILGDTQLLKDAPYAMISAGLGDLIGKFTCLCDWKLSQIINNEYYCPIIVAMVEGCAGRVLESAYKARARDPEILGAIMEGLVFTGVAMSMVGNSRPASGCEHHISHYWEMIFEQQGRSCVPHGIQVGVGTILILKLVEALRRHPELDFESARATARRYDPAAWEREISRAYGPAAPGVIAMEATARKNEATACLARIDSIQDNWTQLSAQLDALPSAQSVMDLLTGLEAPCLPSQIGVDAPLLRDTLLYCKEVRDRYTILQLLWDLGLLSQLVDEVVLAVDKA